MPCLCHGGYFCVLSQLGQTILGLAGEKCLASWFQVSRVSRFTGVSPLHPPESALLHQFTVKLQSAPGAVWMSAQRPVLVFNEVIRTTQIPSIVYPGPGPTWFHLFFRAVWMHKCEQGWKSWLVIFKLFFPPDLLLRLSLDKMRFRS